MTDLFANVNEGDYVRVEFKDGAIEGPVTVDSGIGKGLLNEFAYHPFERLNRYATKVTVLRRALPPEPPTGSVVLDKGGVAWQHAGAGTWFSMGFGQRSWNKLHAQLGPLRVIYTPEGK